MGGGWEGTLLEHPSLCILVETMAGGGGREGGWSAGWQRGRSMSIGAANLAQEWTRPSGGQQAPRAGPSRPEIELPHLGSEDHVLRSM